jgi:acetyltransferase
MFDRLFSPHNVAIIGASRDASSWGHAILKNLIDGGFSGGIFPVNPKADSILGIGCHKSVTDIPCEVDLAIIVIPAPLVPGAVRECGEKRIPFVIIITSGFREAGEGGRALENELKRIAAQYGVRIIGPNCMGVYNAHKSMTATFTSSVPTAGSISFISQSGAIGIAMLAWAKMKGIGFSKFISIGNESDVSLPEILGYLASDPSTDVIALYIESVRDGESFVGSLRSSAGKKPIIAMKVGVTSSGAKTAMSHTGALAVEDGVIDGIFKQFGVVRSRGTEELFMLATSFAALPLPKSRSCLILSVGGGWAVECADLVELAGLTLAPLPEEPLSIGDAMLPPYWSRRNPVDMVASPNPESYYRMLEAMLKRGTCGMVFLIGYGVVGTIAVPSITSKEVEYADAIASLIRSHSTPVFIVDLLGPPQNESTRRFVRLGLPVFETVSSAVAVAAQMARWGERRLNAGATNASPS